MAREAFRWTRSTEWHEAIHVALPSGSHFLMLDYFLPSLQPSVENTGGASVQ